MRILSTLFLWWLTQNVYARQTNPFEKFGNVTAEHLKKKIYQIDSNANAVVLSDIGSTAIEGNSKGWFSIKFTRHRVVHILNKSGYGIANLQIPLQNKDGTEEKLEYVKGVTYNLANGKVVETKLGRSDIFSENVSKTQSLRKFTMPNVKEGSIIEFEYRITSDYITNLDTWQFQENIPVIWSEYKLSSPQFFTYAFLSHGYNSLFIKDRKDKQVSFLVMDSRSTSSNDRTTFVASVSEWRWVMINVPALKPEIFSSALKNHLSSIEFQLISYNYPLPPKDIRSTWQGLISELSESEYFGKDLSKDNNWMSDEIKPLLAGVSNSRDRAKKIYEYVRDHFTCTNYSAIQMNQTLKSIYRSRKGNVAEINLLLTSMLRFAGLDANPVILSTTDHGYALELYPMLSAFNYVISKLDDNGKIYYLDATHPNLGFGRLLPECYNGHARVVDEEATAINLSADSLLEKKVTTVFISNDNKGNWIGRYLSRPGYYESYYVREKIKNSSINNYFRDEQSDFGTDVQILKQGIDSLNQKENPIAVHYNLEFPTSNDDILYINPLFNEGWKKNPFISTERFYPVEMPYTSDVIYLLTMEVPMGYDVDELPNQIIAKLDTAARSFFEYRITYSGSTISMRCRLKLAKTFFPPEEYDTLREFFNLVVTKENEEIVFKRKK